MVAVCEGDMGDEGTIVKIEEKNYEAFYKSLARRQGRARCASNIWNTGHKFLREIFSRIPYERETGARGFPA